MKRLEKSDLLNIFFIKQKSNNLFFYIITALIIVFLYFALAPKVNSRFFAVRRSVLLNRFISQTKKENSINPQNYWQLREFYCPGHSFFNRNSAYKGGPFLIYRCDNFNSTDELVDKMGFVKHTKELSKINKNIIFQNNNEIIYQKNNKIFIIFIKPADEMKKAIGYFDYQEEDIKITKDKYWFNQTEVKVN